MKGDLTIRNKVTDLTLNEFTQETFLFRGDIHVLLLDTRNLKSRPSDKIACLNLNIPATVFLSIDTIIIPCNVNIEAT